jgi:transitional endoplasmic reticulum ATPase
MSYNRLVPRSKPQVIFDDISTTLKLEVVEAYDRKKVGKGIVRVDYNVICSLGIHIGDITEISGKEATMSLYSAPEKENKYILGIDRLTRYNARVATGEVVTISKTNAIVADNITMEPLTAMTISKSSVIDE